LLAGIHEADNGASRVKPFGHARSCFQPLQPRRPKNSPSVGQWIKPEASGAAAIPVAASSE